MATKKITKPLSEIERARAEAVKDICIGIVAREMGYANVTLVCQAGCEVFKYISSLTYKQFRDIKKLKTTPTK